MLLSYASLLVYFEFLIKEETYFPSDSVTVHPPSFDVCELEVLGMFSTIRFSYTGVKFFEIRFITYVHKLHIQY